MTDWQKRLIGLYLLICDEYDTHLVWNSQRMSNNQSLAFSDQEVLTVYLFGLLEGRKRVSEIHRYARNHLTEWFPSLPSYAAFSRRVNALENCFAVLAENLLARFSCLSGSAVLMIDSMPIILAQGVRSSRARSCSQIAQKGYCSSKGYYYGVKFHVVTQQRPGRLPIPRLCCLTGAAAHDLEGLSLMQPMLPQADLYADRAYCSEPVRTELREQKSVVFLTPHKKKPKGAELDYLQQVYNTSISRVRQPIESFFNWMIHRFDIQRASTVRSEKGLRRHIFACIAAAALWFVYP